MQNNNTQRRLAVLWHRPRWLACWVLWLGLLMATQGQAQALQPMQVAPSLPSLQTMASTSPTQQEPLARAIASRLQAMAASSPSISTTLTALQPMRAVTSTLPVTLVALAPATQPASSTLLAMAPAQRPARVTLVALAPATPVTAAALVAMAPPSRTAPVMLARMVPARGKGTEGPLLAASTVSGVIGPVAALFGQDPTGRTMALAGTGIERGGFRVIERPYGEEVFLDLMANRTQYNRGFVAYRSSDGTVWLPLNDMINSLGLGLKVDLANQRIGGWVSNSQFPFEVNLANGSFRSGNATNALPQRAIAKTGNELYVTPATLASWLGGEAKVDLAELQFALTTKDPLPAEVAQARANLWRSRAADPATPQALASRIAYRLYTMPQLRLEGGVQVARAPDGSWQSNQSLALGAEGNLLYGVGSLSLGLNRTVDGQLSLTGGNFRLSRQENDAILFADWLGPWAATRAEAGDIQATALPLGGLGTSGRGVRLNNIPAGQIADPERFVLSGDAPAGWDVEVYQNASLLAFQRVGDSGRYEFKALPLRNGINVFRIVRYGPRGEQDEQEARYNLGDSLLSQGQITYDVSLYQPGAKTLGALFDQNPSDQGLTLTQRYAYGLTPNLTLTAGNYLSSNLGAHNSSTPRSDDTPALQGLSAGLRATMGETFLQADTSLNSQGNQSLQSSLRRTLPGDVNARLAFGANWNQQDMNDQTVLRTYSAELGRLFRAKSFTTDQSIQYDLTQYSNRDDRNTLSLRSGLNARRFSLSNEVAASTPNLGGPLQLAGSVQASANLGNITSARLGLTYDENTPDWVRSVTFGTQNRLTDRLNLNVGARHQLDTESTQMNADLRYQMENLSLGLTAQVADDGNASIGLNLGTALIPTREGWQAVNPQRQVGLAVAEILAFIDTNGNGTRDAGEPPVVGVGITNPMRASIERTNAQGLAILADLPANQSIRLQLDEQTLPNIYLKPTRTQFLVQGSVGSVGEFMLPFEQLGEASGQLFQGSRTGARQPIGQANLELVATNGAIVARTRTAADGFFALGPVPLGSYQIRLTPSEIERTGLSLVPVLVEFNHQSPLQEDLTLEVVPK